MTDSSPGEAGGFYESHRLCRWTAVAATTIATDRTPDAGRRFVVRVSLAAILGAGILSGCATFRKQKVVSDSVATCRQLSCEGVAAMERGHLEHAHELLEKAVKISPGDIEARRQLA